MAADSAPPWGPVRLALSALPLGTGLGESPDGHLQLVTACRGPQLLLHGPLQGLRAALRLSFRRQRQQRAAAAR
eukprot:5228088-Alexandrium_andersonii.AAC.1